jgi:hypothetical protein
MKVTLLPQMLYVEVHVPFQAHHLYQHVIYLLYLRPCSWHTKVKESSWFQRPVLNGAHPTILGLQDFISGSCTAVTAPLNLSLH